MFDFADTLPSVTNMVIFGMMAMTVIPLIKYFFAKYNVPGFTPLAGAI